MTDMSLQSLFNLYELSTGRRGFALRQVHQRALALGFQELVDHVALAIEHERQTRQLDLRWAGRETRQTAVDAAVKPVDILVDRALTSLRDSAAAQVDVATPGDGIAQKVDAFLHALFPPGVAAVTSLSYVEELDAVECIVEKLQGDLAPVVADLGLTRHANRLAALAVEYRTALTTPKPEALTWGEVRAARAQGQEMLLEAVGLIVGHYRGPSPESRAARTQLLAPILEQNEAVRRYLRSRRRVEDVDPDTGEVDPEAPLSGPDPAGGEAQPPA